MRRVLTIDAETTGVEDHDEAVEIAVVDMGGAYEHTLLHTDQRITFPAMGVHHIRQEDLALAPALDEWLNEKSDMLEPNLTSNDPPVMVAHNAQFDMRYLPEALREMDWICTYRCALALLPDAEGHGNQSLRYELDLDVSDMPSEAGGLVHRALYDAWVTRKLLLALMDIVSEKTEWDADMPEPTARDFVEALIEITRNPILLKKVRFGKHSGQDWSTVPRTYLHWILGQDFDRDVEHTARHWLDARR